MGGLRVLKGLMKAIEMSVQGEVEYSGCLRWARFTSHTASEPVSRMLHVNPEVIALNCNFLPSFLLIFIIMTSYNIVIDMDTLLSYFPIEIVFGLICYE